MRKNIKIEYFISNVVENENMEVVNLTAMFEDLYFQIEQGEVIRYEFNNEIARVASLHYDENIRCYQLCFERLRDFNIPVKSSFERESEIIDLEEDEFIGEEVSILYDVTNSITIIQRNRDSLSPTALEMFLRHIYSTFMGRHTNLELNPLLERNTIDYVMESNQIRKIDFRIDDLGQEVEYEDDLSNITQEISRYEAASLDITLSVGREKIKKWSQIQLEGLLDHLRTEKTFHGHKFI